MDLCPLDNNTVEVSGGVNGKLAGGVRTKVKPVSFKIRSKFQDQKKLISIRNVTSSIHFLASALASSTRKCPLDVI